MKKIIGLLSIMLIIALALSFNTKSLNEVNQNINLVDLMEISNANATGIATVPCIDVENSGGAFRKRKCVPCTWDDLPLASAGTCTINYE